MSTAMHVRNVGKSYRVWGSEWLRIASWFGFPVRPKEEHWVLRGCRLTFGRVNPSVLLVRMVLARALCSK